MTSHCRRILPSAAAAAAALAFSGAAQAANVDFSGYVRSGVGTNNKGGDQVCFGLPGAGSKWRLGNECENYGEFNLATDVFRGSDGSRFRYNIMLGHKSTGNDGFEPLGDSNVDSARHIALRQNWIGITGVGGGIMKDTTLWLGKRYYRRHDVHAMDFFYWNNSGDGVGIEDINAGFGKFHVALMRNNADVATTSPIAGDLTTNARGRSSNSLDMRLSNIAVNRGGELEFGLDFRQGDEKDSTATKTKNGYIFNVEHTQSNLWGGFNKLALQQGVDAGGNLGSFAFTTTGQKKSRLVEQMVVQPSRELSVMAAFVYEKTTFDTPGATSPDKWMSIGARPMYQWSEHLGSAVEVGLDRVKYHNGSTGNLRKVTLVPVVVRAGRGAFSRPELRLFATFANWNAEANAAAPAGGNLVSGSDFTSSTLTSGRTIGVQAEAWW